MVVSSDLSNWFTYFIRKELSHFILGQTSPTPMASTTWTVVLLKVIGHSVSYQLLSVWTVNKLWCESTTNPVPVLRIAASRGFSELTQNWISSSHGHSAPSLKISCTSLHTYKQRNQLKTIPRPGSIMDGVINTIWEMWEVLFGSLVSFLVWYYFVNSCNVLLRF